MEHEIKTRWVDGWQFVSTDARGHAVVMDSPSLGDGAGMEPIELLLVALAGCTAMDVISIMKKKGQKVRDFEVKVSGDRRPEHPRAWAAIHVEYIVRGLGIDRVAVERAVELSETKYCSVYANLSPSATMTHSITIEEVE
jgi:putative redox protein